MARRVLVVDDNQDVCFILRRRLGRAGFDVGSATDGVDALQALRMGSWDLVILDLEMPGMGGIELLEQRRSSRGQMPPVVVMTGHDCGRVLERARSLGAVECLPKLEVLRPEFAANLSGWLEDLRPRPIHDGLANVPVAVTSSRAISRPSGGRNHS